MTAPFDARAEAAKLVRIEGVFDAQDEWYERPVIGAAVLTREYNADVPAILEAFTAALEAARAAGAADSEEMRVLLTAAIEKGRAEERARAAAERWGVWCRNEGWCMKGTREEAEAALPDWASGRAADVDPRHFHYEIRKVPT